MVWAVYEPVTGGMCLPDGELSGYEEALKVYYDTEMTDAEKQALGVEERFSAYHMLKKIFEDRGPLNDAECPKVFRLKRTPKKLAAMVTNGPLMVTETLKNVIEAFEPGVHQFWPMTIELPRNKTWPEQYYGLRIATFLDSFRPEESKGASLTPVGERFDSSGYKKFATSLAFSKDVFAGHHLWREVNLVKPEMCMSDELQAAVAEKGLYLPSHWRSKEV